MADPKMGFSIDMMGIESLVSPFLIADVVGNIRCLCVVNGNCECVVDVVCRWMCFVNWLDD